MTTISENHIFCIEITQNSHNCLLPIGALLEFTRALLEFIGAYCFIGAYGMSVSTNEDEPTINKLPGVWWTEGLGFGISSIASSSLGDRKKGYPKRQALWESFLATPRVRGALSHGLPRHSMQHYKPTDQLQP